MSQTLQKMSQSKDIRNHLNVSSLTVFANNKKNTIKGVRIWGLLNGMDIGLYQNTV